MRFHSLRSFNAYADFCSVSLSLNNGKKRKTFTRTGRMPRKPRRTIRKLTCWTADEWRRVEEAARPRGVPPLRYVREAVLMHASTGGELRPQQKRRRRPADELVHQLARVMNNLRQLRRVAEDDWDDDSAHLFGAVLQTAELATRDAPERGSSAAAILAELQPAGVALNELAHRANTAECLPPEAEVHAVIQSLHRALVRCLA